jgi:hypothetical protein
VLGPADVASVGHLRGRTSGGGHAMDW